MRLKIPVFVIGLGSLGWGVNAQAIDPHPSFKIEPRWPSLNIRPPRHRSQVNDLLSPSPSDSPIDLLVPSVTCPMPVAHTYSPNPDSMPVAKGGSAEPMPVARSGCSNPLDPKP